jgi:four helix bundle protein
MRGTGHRVREKDGCRSVDLHSVPTRALTDGFPTHERYGLVQQVRRAAVSIPSNIAEGHGRDHLGDYLRLLSVANGSLMEVETQMLIARQLGYLTATEEGALLNKTAEVGRMLSGLTGALKKRTRVATRP